MPMPSHPFAEALPDLAPDEAEFGARNPNLLIRDDARGILICFVGGLFRTSDPATMDYLIAIVDAEATRGGHPGTWVRALPAQRRVAALTPPTPPKRRKAS